MRYLTFIWDDPEDSDGNIQHIARHDLSPEDVEEVLRNSTDRGTTRSTGRRCAWGYTAGGDYILVVYDEIEPMIVRVITAFEVNELD